MSSTAYSTVAVYALPIRSTRAETATAHRYHWNVRYAGMTISKTAAASAVSVIIHVEIRSDPTAIFAAKTQKKSDAHMMEKLSQVSGSRTVRATKRLGRPRFE